MSSSPRYAQPVRSVRAVLVALAALAALALGVPAAASAKKPPEPQVYIVSHGSPPASIPANVHYSSTIQGAVNQTVAGDWVLIEPGTYDEEVTVTSAHSGIWIRGMNRNTVIVDGQHKVGNGFDVVKADNVWIENLTVRNFEFGEGCDVESCGNEIWWDGGADSGKIGAHGWYGNYLTAYETGMRGGYGIFTNNETEGEFENIYASGFADSGLYIGACQECKATVTGAVMEDNALGYSGSNSVAASSSKGRASPTTRSAMRPTRKIPATSAAPGRRMQPAGNPDHADADHHLDQDLKVHGDPEGRIHRQRQPQRAHQRVDGSRPMGCRGRDPRRLRRPGRTRHHLRQPERRCAGLQVPEPVPAAPVL